MSARPTPVGIVADRSDPGSKAELGTDRERGLDAMSRLEQARGEREVRPRVVIVDEAGMIGTRNLAPAHRRTRAGRELILAGDLAQLPSVTAGGVFHVLHQHDGERVQLRPVQRQRDPLEIAALAALRSDPARDREQDGEGVEAHLEHKARRGEITIHRDRHDALNAAHAWWTERLDPMASRAAG